MYVNSRPSMDKSSNVNWFCGSNANSCSFVLGICLIVLALLEAGTIIVSQFWWGFIGVGLVLIAGLLLLAGSFIAKPIVYRLFFVVCIIAFIANIALFIYAFLTGLNQLQINKKPDSFEDSEIDWRSERVRGIFNLTYSALDLLKIGALILAFGSAFAHFRFLKSTHPLRSRIAAFTTSRDDGVRNVVENVEMVEEDRCERVTTTPYY